MPHAWIEYSGNIADQTEVETFGQCVHAAMTEALIFPIAGIRIRITRIDDCLVGDMNPDNGFVHLSLRIGEGRDAKTKQEAANLIFDRTSSHLKPLADRARLAYAMEMQEIPSAYSYKMNNLHKHLKAS